MSDCLFFHFFPQVTIICKYNMYFLCRLLSRRGLVFCLKLNVTLDNIRFQLNRFQKLLFVQACSNNYMSLRYSPVCSSSFNSTLGERGRKISFKSWSLQGMFIILVLCAHAWRNTSVKLVKLTRMIGKTYLWNFACKQEQSSTLLIG